ncbi:NAD-dependent epimerase/dehydratase family protein [Roseobacter sp. HKCCD9010]|uniref:SDR family oxidoreductase n=1 Tax=unclassified Roseobacter TaxID=196798 RepID=UPI001491CAD1|nr:MULTISPECIES: aldehyde reductase [unclassified Roseobacter]MBF9049073.1 NAD-dependent epimerase/dehydratase family protein [Rhodobacterales bacterium HKCCD4356]NNV11073.1 NAD-dependent epimerase/dehydratase family protein [Roseobacter sp. HKCCD7357]NNV15257.1 NAD-dependent epimerase/dehydratase family protein [Roseobacter sp. HKCCD8768]NNV24717.1 NAD-dependent epimerase/dehydratase family protein [Roseobacter sp. HKCCD8192]NNV28973.1 NAD-dependent epimerase/dehydratase family protein [Roseo
MTETAAKPLVLVTGATGFIGQHVILQLLETGYRVRGTMRSLSKADHVRETLAQVTDKIDNLSFAAVDLTSDDGWPEAMEGVTFVQHVASPFPMGTPDNPDDLIIPARDGALRALRFAKAAGVKRVVLTSSVAAIGYGHGDDLPEVVDETLWSPSELVKDHTAYSLSKTIAERAAWDFIETEGAGMELSVINPALVLGPMVGKDDSTSLQIVNGLMTGMFPAYPDFGFGVVDVRDVAKAHLLAMEHPKAAGERFLVSAEYMMLREMGETIRATYPDHARKVPKWDMPSWLMRLMAIAMPSARQILPELGRRRRSSAAKAERVLGWQPRPARDAVVASAGDLIEKGFV